MRVALEAVAAEHVAHGLVGLVLEEPAQVLDGRLLHGQPLDEVRDYFGEKIALYFAFIEELTVALLVPSALLALGGLDGTGRVGALNWRRLREWFDVRTLVLDPQDRSSRASRVGSLGRVAE